MDLNTKNQFLVLGLGRLSFSNKCMSLFIFIMHDTNGMYDRWEASTCRKPELFMTILLDVFSFKDINILENLTGCASISNVSLGYL